MPKYRDCSAFIIGLGSSVPEYRFSQDTIGAFMRKHMTLDDTSSRWVSALIKQSGIDFRHSVIPDFGSSPKNFQFFPDNDDLEPFPGVSARMKYYQTHAPVLGTSAATACLNNARLDASSVTHLITVSCTGMYAPGLDIDLVERLGLPSSVERTCINFMGCYAAFNAMKTASAIVRSNPSARVLIVCVELCSLHFQKNGLSNSGLLTNMLFSDGASAALVSGERAEGRSALELLNFACDLFPDGKSEMTWEISDFGFAMKLTNQVAPVLRDNLPRVFDRLMEGIDENSVRHYAFHPGGPKVLEVLEAVCGIGKTENRWAYEVLRQFGNMSSATLFFILERLMQSEKYENGELLFSAAFGPGLTCESALMRFAV